MTPTQREAAEWLTNALDNLPVPVGYVPDVDDAIALLRELLAEPVQEPVAWFCGEPGNLREVEHWANGAFPVYTHPPQQRKPLTDEEIAQIWDVARYAAADHLEWHAFARAVERAITGKPT